MSRFVPTHKPCLPPDIIGIDFFCGAGGATHGFLKAGIDIICGIDSDTSAKETYEHNNIRKCGKHSKLICADVDKELTKEMLEAEIGDRSGKALVFIGCPPCQPFTNLKTVKENQGTSDTLLLSFLHHIKQILPEYVLVENVPGIRQRTDVFQKFLNGLVSLGYHIPDYRVINAKRYGVPQSRKRLVLLTSLLAPINIPDETHGPGTDNPYVTAGSVISQFPSIRAGETHSEVQNHRAANLSE